MVGLSTMLSGDENRMTESNRCRGSQLQDEKEQGFSEFRLHVLAS